MNGRAYDPELGRFLGVDPYISKPLNSQSLNPYSYVSNNPIMGTDPTGYREEAAFGAGLALAEHYTNGMVSGARVVENELASGTLDSSEIAAGYNGAKAFIKVSSDAVKADSLAGVGAVVVNALLGGLKNTTDNGAGSLDGQDNKSTESIGSNANRKVTGRDIRDDKNFKIDREKELEASEGVCQYCQENRRLTAIM